MPHSFLSVLQNAIFLMENCQRQLCASLLDQTTYLNIPEILSLYKKCKSAHFYLGPVHLRILYPDVGENFCKFSTRLIVALYKGIANRDDSKN